ncbi:MAG: hypothetical protein Ta2F_10550 [Termitinemataceae bacterium]|nr:MAG: hypothetical protein Ta2F_10550 [Termitinemataceae bacterium]
MTHRLHTGKTILAAFMLAIVIKAFFFDFMIVSGTSMLPSINNGKVIIVNRLSYGFKLPVAPTYFVRWQLPHNGDVVVFITPFGDVAVKRCAELVQNNDGGFFFIAVGDNSVESYDSRSYGPVSVDNIIGRAFGIK